MAVVAEPEKRQEEQSVVQTWPNVPEMEPRESVGMDNIVRHFEDAGEDWTKLSNPYARRRVQNRIAQRKYRTKLKHRRPEPDSDFDQAQRLPSRQHQEATIESFAATADSYEQPSEPPPIQDVTVHHSPLTSREAMLPCNTKGQPSGPSVRTDAKPPRSFTLNVRSHHPPSNQEPFTVKPTSTTLPTYNCTARVGDLTNNPRLSSGGDKMEDWRFIPPIRPAGDPLPRPKPRCWEGDCDGQEFSKMSNLRRHLQRHHKGTKSQPLEISGVQCKRIDIAKLTPGDNVFFCDECIPQRKNSVSFSPDDGPLQEISQAQPKLSMHNKNPDSPCVSQDKADLETPETAEDESSIISMQCRNISNDMSSVSGYAELGSSDKDDGACEEPSVSREDLLDRLMTYFCSVFSKYTSSKQQNYSHSLSMHPVPAEPSDLGTFDECQQEAESSKQTSPEFACPFFKKNPEFHRDYISCSGPGWTTVHLVKEHVYRRHSLPITCPRCHITFETTKLKDEHSTAFVRCEAREAIPVEGMDAAQKELLRRRKKRANNMDEMDQWEQMYLILFPETDEGSIPSPYYNPENTSVELSEEIPAEFTLYEELLQKDLPINVQKELEIRIDEIDNPTEVNLRTQLSSIVRQVQTRLVQMYQSSEDTTGLDSYGDGTMTPISTCDQPEEGFNIEEALELVLPPSDFDVINDNATFDSLRLDLIQSRAISYWDLANGCMVLDSSAT